MKTVFLSLIALILVISGCVVAPHTRFIASKIEGQLLNAGQPLVNVPIAREIVTQHSGEKQTQRAVTDANGRFVLEEVTSIGFVQSIATWVYHFEIRAQVDEKGVLVWKGWKTDNNRFGDYRSAKGFFVKQGDALKFTYDIAERK